MIVGCYTVDLYCDCCAIEHGEYYRGTFMEFTGRNEAECKRKAKPWGWTFKGNKARCKRCKEAGKKFPEDEPK